MLGWSDENKQIGGEDAMKLGAPLASADNLALLHLTCKLFTNKFKYNSIVSIQTGLMQAWDRYYNNIISYHSYKFTLGPSELLIIFIDFTAYVHIQ